MYIHGDKFKSLVHIPWAWDISALWHRFRKSSWCNMLLLNQLNECIYLLIIVDFHSTFLALRAFMSAWTILHIFQSILYWFNAFHPVVHYVVKEIGFDGVRGFALSWFSVVYIVADRLLHKNWVYLHILKVKCDNHQGFVWKPDLYIQLLWLRSCVFGINVEFGRWHLIQPL